MMRLQDALNFLPNARLVGDGETLFSRVHTDTRSLQHGDLFVALDGEHFNAQEFLQQAWANGAACAIATHGLQAAGLAGLEVADTRQALQQLALCWRKKFDLPLIAVTGSNGKTTVTQMVASILDAWQGTAAFATLGNFNNDIGVPLTLLRLNASHKVGVVELGMNHPGEIARLSTLVQPHVALVNNAQREHLEFMQTVEAVALENGAVIAELAASGTAIFPADDPFSPLWRKMAVNRRVLTFALAQPGDAAEAIQAAEFSAVAHWQITSGCWLVKASTPEGAIAFSLAIPGLHNVKNAMAACACAWAVGVPLQFIASGLTAFLPVQGRSRSQRILLADNQVLSLVDDSYNANPDSMQAAIELLAGLPGPRLLVMGDMGEVGSEGPFFHAQAGHLAHAKEIEHFYTFGPLAALACTAFAEAAKNSESAVDAMISCRHFADIDELNAAVLKRLTHDKGAKEQPIQSVLVKGSRFMRCERIVQAIVQFAKP